MDTDRHGGSQAAVSYVDPVSPMVPVMERERFAALVGVEPGVVSGWIERGHVPTLKIGRYRLINLVALTREALAAEGAS